MVKRSYEVNSQDERWNFYPGKDEFFFFFPGAQLSEIPGGFELVKDIYNTES